MGDRLPGLPRRVLLSPRTCPVVGGRPRELVGLWGDPGGCPVSAAWAGVPPGGAGCGRVRRALAGGGAAGAPGFEEGGEHEEEEE